MLIIVWHIRIVKKVPFWNRKADARRGRQLPSPGGLLFAAALDIQRVERLLTGGGQGHAAADGPGFVACVVKAFQGQGKIHGNEPLDL